MGGGFLFRKSAAKRARYGVFGDVGVFRGRWATFFPGGEDGYVCGRFEGGLLVYGLIWMNGDALA